MILMIQDMNADFVTDAFLHPYKLENLLEKNLQLLFL